MTRDELLKKLVQEREALAEKIKALQGFILKIEPYSAEFVEYMEHCRMQLTHMQWYHSSLCKRVQLIDSGATNAKGESLVDFINTIYSK